MQIRVKMMYLLVYTPFSANPSQHDVDLFTVLYALQCKYENTWLGDIPLDLSAEFRRLTRDSP